MAKIFKRVFLSVLVALFVFSTPLVANADFEGNNGNIPVITVDGTEQISYENTVSYEEMREYLVKSGASSKEIDAFDKSNSSIVQSRSTGQLRYLLLQFTTSTTKVLYKTQFRVTSGMMFYADSNGQYSSPSAIVSLEGAHIYTGAGNNCIFTGAIVYKLVNKNTVYWNYYGDLYKAGQVSWTAGASVGVGKSATITGSVSNGSGYISNISYSDSSTLSGI